DQMAIGRDVEQLLSVAPPYRRTAALVRDLPLTLTNESPHEGLLTAGLVGDVRQEASARGEARARLAVGTCCYGHRFSVSGEREQQDIAVAARRIPALDRQPRSVRRPVQHPAVRADVGHHDLLAALATRRLDDRLESGA